MNQALAARAILLTCSVAESFCQKQQYGRVIGVPNVGCHLLSLFINAGFCIVHRMRLSLGGSCPHSYSIPFWKSMSIPIALALHWPRHIVPHNISIFLLHSTHLQKNNCRDMRCSLTPTSYPAHLPILQFIFELLCVHFSLLQT
jgi:hypothetical protein